MTPINANQIARVLQATGPMQALALARRLRRKCESIYEPLVAAEALGLVRVNVEGDSREVRLWEAMAEQ